MRALLLIAALVLALSGCSEGGASPWSPAPRVDPVATSETVFLATLDGEGIVYGQENKAGMLALGHKICEVLAQGTTETQAANVLVRSGGYRPYDAGFIVGAAKGSICKVGR
jgi:hypothetical protein